MVSNVRGSFKKLTGKVVFDESNPSATVVQASIDVSTVDTGEPARDTHLKSPDFFDLAKFPTMTFVSRSAIRTSQGVDLSGDLTLHGVTKAVVLHVSDITKEIKDPRGMLRIGATATTVINRQDFGMVWNHNLDGGGVVVGNDVTITIDIEVARKAA
jgi:polyisoprenoid-binding protein YceI